MCERCKGCAISERVQAARTSPYTVRTDNASKIRSSAAVGEEPEAELSLAYDSYQLLDREAHL